MKTWHWIALGILTLISLILEFTLLADYKSHWWNYIPGFYIIWGFISCVLIIYISKWLGKLFIFKNEQYYDR
ncbi:MAG: hypothetical protein WD513_02410 [Balneolaceae bacterium]